MPMEDVIMVSVPVTDQGRALAFYVGKLGLTLSRVDESLPGVRRVQVTTSGTTTLSLVTWLESMPAGCLYGVVFRSGDLQADYERLAAAGVEFDGPPFAGPDGTCQAVFHDPDGNTLVLQADVGPVTRHRSSRSVPASDRPPRGRPTGRMTCQMPG